LQAFPLNFKEFPYVLIKDCKSLTVVNTQTNQARVVFKNSPYLVDVLRTSLFAFSNETPEPGELVFYNLECEKTSSQYQIFNSYLRKYKINLEDLAAVFK
jgi:hypothetical protein